MHLIPKSLVTNFKNNDTLLYNGERHILKNQCLSVILFKFDEDLFFLIIGGIQKQEENPI